jgi:tetratricopeptide (TPR) repeat protein
MALAWRESRRVRLLVLFVLVYVASFVLFFVADRYRLPVVPALLLFGAYALTWVWERVRRGETKRLGPAAAALAALGVFVNVDWYRTTTPATWALDHWSAGNRYRDMGHLPEAAARYRRALSLDPVNPEIWINLGAVQFAAGRLADATGSFGRALRLAPANSTIYFNLAQCELQRGRRARARRYLEEVVRLEPGDAGARAALSRLRGRN